jgi:general secretion pathway protein B
MSFILDALKKSEAERQRQSGPTLLELRITQPRRRYPAWALWVGILLALNAAVLMYTVLRRPAALSGPSAAPTLAGPAAPAAAGTGPRSAESVAAPTLAAARTAPPGASPAAAGGVSAVAPLASTAAAEGVVPTTSANPADDEPAVPASSAAAADAGTGAAAAAAAPLDYTTLPSLASLGGDMPSLQLNLLVSSEIPGERFALINMHRVHEGDVLPEGPRVLAITRQGVAMDYRGQDFMLHPSGSASP